VVLVITIVMAAVMIAIVGDYAAAQQADHRYSKD
jgi:hypothetical protein